MKEQICTLCIPNHRGINSVTWCGCGCHWGIVEPHEISQRIVPEEEASKTEY